jgi:hypothetical protein
MALEVKVQISLLTSYDLTKASHVDMIRNITHTHGVDNVSWV